MEFFIPDARDAPGVAALVCELNRHLRLEPRELNAERLQAGITTSLRRVDLQTEVVVARDRGRLLGCLINNLHRCDLWDDYYYCTRWFLPPDEDGRRAACAFVAERERQGGRYRMRSLVPARNTAGHFLAKSLGMASAGMWLFSRQLTGEDIQGLCRTYGVDDREEDGRPCRHAAFFLDGESYEVHRAESAHEIEYVAAVTHELYTRQLGVPLTTGQTSAGVQRTRDHVNPADGWFYVLCSWRGPVGCVRCMKEFSPLECQRRCYLRRLYLQPELRRRRLARPFLEAVVALNCCRNRRVEARTLVKPPPTPAEQQTTRKVFESLGLRFRGPMSFLESAV